MSVKDKLTSSSWKSVGMLSIVPPIVATGATLWVVDKSLKRMEKGCW